MITFTKYPAEQPEEEEQQLSNFKDREFKSRGQKNSRNDNVSNEKSKQSQKTWETAMFFITLMISRVIW